MNKQIVSLSMFFIISASCFCFSCASRQESGISKGVQKGIHNGKYRINYDISDMVCEQIIEITNSTQSSNSTNYSYTITIKEDGSLHGNEKQTVITSGVVSDGKYKFIIPCIAVAPLLEVEAYYFQGNNEFDNRMLKGTGNYYRSGRKLGDFNFKMKRLTP